MIDVHNLYMKYANINRIADSKKRLDETAAKRTMYSVMGPFRFRIKSDYSEFMAATRTSKRLNEIVHYILLHNGTWVSEAECC